MSNPALLRVLRSGSLTDTHIGQSTRVDNPFPLFAGERYHATFSAMPASHAKMSPEEHSKAMAKMKGGDKKKEKKGDDSSSESESDGEGDSKPKKKEGPATKKESKSSTGGGASSGGGGYSY